MVSTTEDSHRASSRYFCTDCVRILERVRDMEKQPPTGTVALRVPEDKENSYLHFKDAKDFEQSDYFGDLLREDDSVRHKSTRHELSISAESGCTMCYWLLNSLESRSECKNSHFESWYRRRSATVRKDPYWSPLGKRCVGHYYVELRIPALVPANPYHVSVDVRKPGNSTRREALQTVHDDEKASLIIDPLGKLSTESPGLLDDLAKLEEQSPSTAVWSLLRRWLELCTSGHAECSARPKSHIDSIGPTRLLDLNHPDLVRLVETPAHWSAASNRPRYATLSYCQDDELELRLNRETTETLKSGMLTTSLPPTFKDAVFLAKRLDIPYLWIDILCVQQDSPSEQEKDFSRVGAIFQNCYLCIAATMATNNTSGLVKKRGLTYKRPLVYHDLIIQEDLATMHQLTQCSQCNRIRTLIERGIDSTPLNQRTLALQQRMFAPRIIHCTPDEFMWECNQGIRSESHPLITSGGGVAKNAWRDLLNGTTASQGANVQDNYKKKCLKIWGELINVYSQTKDPRLIDKLAGCSAIAREFEPILGEYLAGLWKAYLPEQLLWSHVKFCQHCERLQDATHILRPRGHPSWSWASLDCGVHLYGTGLHHGPGSPEPNFPALVRILDVNVVRHGEEMTGHVDGGAIRLRGWLYPVYRSVAFGYRLDKSAPPALNDFVDQVSWSWDNHFDFECAADIQTMNDAMKPVDELERKTLSQGSVARFELIHRKRMAHHVPKLTSMVCLPVFTTPVPKPVEMPKFGTQQKHKEHQKGDQQKSRSTSETQWGNRLEGSVEGLVLLFTGKKGQYRRVGHFVCRVLDKVYRVHPAFEPTLLAEWPSSETQCSEEGYTITIV
ncbi:MAG: hypothetical protein M1818_000024 [Claussenomyces sp. TS43310]|nr:MAG: hypothetical protein M1818_000024 [Claussenomyces sp. TS43310]